MVASLAVLPLEQIEDLVPAGQHDVVEPQEGLGSATRRQGRPTALGLTRSGEGICDVRGRGLGKNGERVAGERGGRGHRLAGGGDPCRQPPDQRASGRPAPTAEVLLRLSEDCLIGHLQTGFHPCHGVLTERAHHATYMDDV